MTDKLSNKVVIITGASSGIGAACARSFARAGCRLILAARNIHKLESLKTELEKQHTEVLCIQTDVTKEKDCKQMVEQTVANFERIDVLINNAGISMRAMFNELDLGVLRKVMDTNFWGSVYCTKYALPYILKSNGSIVGISSIAGYRGLPARTGYSASKFALQGFLESLRTEHLHDDINVLVVCPGFTASNIRSVALNKDGSKQGESPRDEQKMMSSETVANHIVAAVAKRKRSLVLTSQGKMTVFLNKWFPGFMDKMVYNHMAKEPDSPLKK